MTDKLRTAARPTLATDLSVVEFLGGHFGALVPFLFFLGGVIWLGLSGAPDERGFWPILIGALFLGLLLARDRSAYAEALLAEMSQPIVLLMILAWLFAGVLGTLLAASHLVEGLVWLADSLGLAGGGYVATAFLIACVVSTATGTSLGTVIVCGPLLYPAGAALGASPAVLMGAILGGATFGDNVSPVSDTTIASATSQGAELGGVVASRIKYALPAAAVALVGYVLLGGGGVSSESATTLSAAASGARGLPMLLVPALVIFLLLRRCHLLQGLLFGIAAAVVLGPLLGLIELSEILYVDVEQFGARGLIVSGVERGLGISIFTILLTGLVGGMRASGLLDALIAAIESRSRDARGAEIWIFVGVSLAVLLTTHSVVALLAVAPLARSAGERFGISAARRANVLDVTVCTYPFLVPYCIPTVLAATVSASGTDVGFPRLSPLEIGLYNFHSWMLLAIVLFAVLTGWGRGAGSRSASG